MSQYDAEDFFEVERLHRAAFDGDIPEMARLVAAGYSLELFDDLEKAPLHYAVENDQLEAVKWLLDHGANINSNNEPKIGETALCIAAQGLSLQVVEFLLKRGADPDINGWMGLTARIRAHRRKDAVGQNIATLIEKYRPARPPHANNRR
jgi:ankyrin repeat protein